MTTRDTTWALLVGGLALLAPEARGQGAIGFQPVVTQWPDGVSLQTAPVVSADRRYVRLGVNARFNALRGVDAFSFPGGAVSGGPGGIGGLGGLGVGGGFGSMGVRPGNGVVGGPVPTLTTAGFGVAMPGDPFGEASALAVPGVGYGPYGARGLGPNGRPPLTGSALGSLIGTIEQTGARRGYD